MASIAITATAQIDPNARRANTEGRRRRSTMNETPARHELAAAASRTSTASWWPAGAAARGATPTAFSADDRQASHTTIAVGTASGSDVATSCNRRASKTVSATSASPRASHDPRLKVK